MKYYYCRADVLEGVPSYDFVLQAEDKKIANELAIKELEDSYPAEDFPRDEVYVEEVSCFEDLLKKLLIN